MKRFLVFTLILVSSLYTKTFACYFYPYGEDLRFCFFHPDNIGYRDYRMFNYTSQYYYEDIPSTDYENTILGNDILWQKYCNNNVDFQSIKEVLYELKITDINRSSKNKMLRNLYKNNRSEAIEYILFAKSTESLSDINSDYWEKNQAEDDSKREDYIKMAVARADKSKDLILKKRYLFQALKLARYSGDSKTLLTIYNKYFEGKKKETLLDYWAMYFRMTIEKNDIYTNYLAAQVFANAPDKRYEIRWYFNKNIPVEQVVKYAKSNEEIGNIWQLYAFKKSDRALDNLNNVYRYNPSSKGLGFMLLREVNKLEDWILTPEYTLFLPSIRDDYWENSNPERILQRVEIDRNYAGQVLNFVNEADLKKVENPIFWKVAKAYLQFLTNDNKASLESIAAIENHIQDGPLKRQLEIIKALSLTASQQMGEAVIQKEIKPIIIREFKDGNFKFVFGIAKELEELGNTTDAAFLYSKLEEAANVYWKSKGKHHTIQDDYYYNWYNYLDANYSVEQLNGLLSSIRTNVDKDSFDIWKTSTLKSENNRLNDLLGIKYIRENNLKSAYAAFSKIKGDYEMNNYFNEDPFFEIKGSPKFTTKKGKVNFTKSKVVKLLMTHLQKAGNVKEKNRDYHYFLAANCYYNMTYYGNSWMMRRIYWSSSQADSYLSDEKEYNECTLAKQYYQKAYAMAKTDKFKALCLYMIGKCDARKSEYNKFGYGFRDYDSKVTEQSFSELKKQFPRDYGKLTSSCEFYEVYFESRR